MHFLRSHLGYLPKNFGDSSEEICPVFPLGYSHHGITLPRPVGCELSYGLLLVVETKCGDYAAKEKITKKAFSHD